MAQPPNDGKTGTMMAPKFTEVDAVFEISRLRMALQGIKIVAAGRTGSSDASYQLSQARAIAIAALGEDDG